MPSGHDELIVRRREVGARGQKGKVDGVVPLGTLVASADGVAATLPKAVELRQQGMTHPEVCDELNRLGFRTRAGQPWRHPQQIVMLLRSFPTK